MLDAQMIQQLDEIFKFDSENKKARHKQTVDKIFLFFFFFHPTTAVLEDSNKSSPRLSYRRERCHAPFRSNQGRWSRSRAGVPLRWDKSQCDQSAASFPILFDTNNSIISLYLIKN